MAGWDLSIISEPEGTTVYAGNGIFIADNTSFESPSPSQIRDLYMSLKKLADINFLKVLYAVYEMTYHDINLYVSTGDIAAKAKLPETEALHVLDDMPVEIKEEGGSILYRIKGSYMPALLLMLKSGFSD